MSNTSVVFIVDDDPAVRHSLQWLLESAGYRVAAYSSAEGFIAALEQNGCNCRCGEPACGCLVVDLQMPGMNGLELQRSLAQHCPSLPLIFVSGHANEQQIKQAMAAGAAAFITKPFNDEQLLKQIQLALQSNLNQGNP